MLSKIIFKKPTISNKTKNLPLLASLFLFAGISIAGLNNASIWFDEAFSAYIIRFDWAKIWHFTSVDVHPPLYYFLLKAWSGVFGSSDFALRAMSAFFGMLTLLVVYVFIKKAFGQKPANITAFFLAISPMLIRYSQEVRMYTLTAFWGSLAVLAFYIVWVENNNIKTQKRWRAIYILAVVMGLWTQYLSALVPISLWAYRVFMTWKKQQKPTLSSIISDFWAKNNFRLQAKHFLAKIWAFIKAVLADKWLTSHLWIALFFAPWLPFFVKQATAVKSGFWIKPLDFSTIPSFLSSFLTFRDSPEVDGVLSILLGVILVSFFVFMVKTLSDKKQRLPEMLLLIFVAVLPIAGLFLASLPPSPSIFVDRYLLPSVVFLTSLLVVSIFKMSEKSRRGAVILAILLVLANGLGVVRIFQFAGSKTQNSASEAKQAVAKIRRESGDNPILVDGWALYYEAAQYSGAKNQIFSYGELPAWGSADMLRDPATPRVENLADFIKQNSLREIWILRSLAEPEIKDLPANWRISHQEIYRDSLSGGEKYQILKLSAK